MKKIVLGAAALCVCAIAGTVMAQQSRPQPTSSADNACLQYNRLDRWSVVNGKTLSVTDKTDKKFRVALSSDCAHSTFVDRVVFQRIGKSGLDCVEAGDRVRLFETAMQPQLCLVSSVSLYTDAQRKLDQKTNPTKP